MNQYFFTFLLFFLFSFNANSQTNCTINAGANSTWCGSQGIHLDGHAAGVIQGKTLWRQISGPASMIQDAAALQTDVLPPLPAGIYVFELSATCEQGMAVQQVTHTVGLVLRPDAGSDVNIPCFSSGFIQLNPKNIPLSPFTAEWTVLRGNGYVNNARFYPSVRVDACPPSQGYILQYSFINNKGCRFSDSLIILIDNFVPDIIIETGGGGCGGGAPYAKGTCPGKGTVQWTFINPPGGGGASFTNPTSMLTQFNNLVPGQEYIIEYTINNPNCNSKSKRDTFIAPRELKYGTRPIISTEGYREFKYNGEKYIVFCGAAPDSVIFYGNLPNFPEGEKVEWQINLSSCDIWTLTIQQPNPILIELNKTKVALVNLQFGFYELQYVIESSEGCGASDKIKIAVLPDGYDITYYTSNNCEDPDYSKFNIGCRKSSGLDAVMTDAYYHFPIPRDLIPIINENIKYIVDGLDFKPINNPNALFTTKADMCFNNTTHQYQYFINISKDAPTGTYIYEMPVVYGSAGIPSCNGSKARFIIDLSSPPDTARGGTDQLICGMSTGLAGNTVKTPEWKFLSVQPKAAATPVIASPASIITNVSGMSIDATYKFLYRSYGGEFCGSTYDTVTVRTAQFPPPQPNAGADQNICSGGFVQLRARPSPIPAGVEGTWTVVSPSGANLIFTDIHDPDARVSGLIPGTSYTLRFTLRNGCDQSGKSDDVVITVSANPGANAPDAGRDKCLPLGTTSITLAASPLAPTGTAGLWSQAAGNPPGASISNPAVEITQASGLTSGTYRFVWTVSLAPCPAQSDTVVITIGGSKAKVKESLINICNNATPLSATLEAEAPQGPLGTWIQTDGAAALIQSPSSPITTVTGLMPGIYKFLWVIDNGVCSSSKEVELRIGRTTPIADAGIDQVYCPEDSIINLSAIPAPSGMIGFWSIEDIEPGISSIGVDFLPSTEVTNPKAKIKLKPGRNRLRWNIIADPVCGDQPSIDDVIIDYIPEATLPFDTLKLCNASTVPLESTFSGLAATGIWSQISGPQTSGLPHTTADAAPLMLGLSGPGIYVFEYCISSNDCPTTCDRVTVINSPTFAAFPVKDRDTICAKNEILLKGAALAPGFTARWEYIRGPVGSWQINYSPNANSNEVAVTPAQNGTYLFRYIVSNGGCELSTTVIDSVRVGTVDAGSDLALCGQKTAQLSSPPPGYKWTYESTGMGNVAVDATSGAVSGLDSSGTFLFRLTAPDGCYDLMKITKLGTGILLSKQPDSIKTCVGGNNVLSVNASTSFGSIRYQWQQSNTGPTGNYSNVGSNNSTYTPAQNLAGLGHYRVILTNAQNNCSDTSRVIPVEVISDPSISAITRDTGACQGARILMSSTVGGGFGQLGYQWQSANNPSGPWTNINAANGLSYSVSPAPGTYYYRMNFVATGLQCDTASSSPVRVIIDPTVIISIGAKDITACVGAIDSFRINAVGGQVEWESSNQITGPFTKINNTGSSIPANTSMAGTFFYRAILKSANNYCSDTDAVVKLTVLPDPALTLFSRDTGLCEGSSLLFSAVGTGGILPLTYQWQNSSTRTGPWNDINGATNSQYNPSSISGIQYYRLVLKSSGNGCDDALSSAIELKVDPKPNITLDLKDKLLCQGALDTLKIQVTGGTFNYNWRSSPTQNGPFTNQGINAPELVPLTNQLGDMYYLVAIASVNTYCRDTTSLIKVTVVADPVISLQPRDTAVCPGKLVVLSASGTQGISPLSYQWEYATNPAGPWTDIAGATQSNYNVNTAQSGIYYYRMIVKSPGRGCDDAITRTAEIKINATVGVNAQPVGFTQCIGGQQQLSINASGNNIQYQWQSSKNGNNWTNVIGANASNYTPPSNRKDSVYYRCVLTDPGNADCGTDTSKYAIVITNTDFSLWKDTLEVCGFDDGVRKTTLDFSKFILTGDKNATWNVIGAALPPGPWTAKDFSGIAPGTIFKFVATTTDQIAPCINVSDTVIVKVILCCPSVCTKAPSSVLCNQSQVAFNLQSLLCNGTQPGNWSIIAGPGITTPQALLNGTLLPTQYAAGAYRLQYKLNQSTSSCIDTSTQWITIVKAPFAGNKIQNSFSLCEKKDSIISLNNTINGQDNGGVWRSNNFAINSLINANGSINLNTLSNGVYKLRYVVSATGCSSDSVEIEFVINKAPFADAGFDGRLSCDTPTVFIGNSLNISNNVDVNWRLVGGSLIDPSLPRIETGTPGTYIIEVRDRITGCINRDTSEVIAAEAFITDVRSISKDPVCFGEKNASIEVTGIDGGSAPFTYILLDPQQKELSRNTNGKFNTLYPGKYTVKIEDKNGCVTTRAYEIIQPDPLDVELLSDTTISCRDSVYLKVRSGIDPLRIEKLIWYSDGVLIDTLPVFGKTLHPSNTTRYSIRVRDVNGCLIERVAVVKVDIAAHVYAPNVFSPNGDNLNDIFKLVFSENVDYIYAFALYDRWGERMYSKENFYPTDDYGWDGIFRLENSMPGVYVWVAKIRACDDRIETLVGDVTLVR